jgi:hypothetical protein
MIQGIMKKVIILLFLIACAQIPEKQPVQEVPVKVELPTPRAQPIIPAPSVVCTDSDGLNEFVKGRIVRNGKELFDSCLSVKSDGLVPLSKVLEYVCENGEIVAKIVNCEFGCESGACLSAPRAFNMLVENGRCAEGAIIQDSIKITKCYSPCLPNTMCRQQPVKTKHLSLPWQLSCVVPNDAWVADTWVEFSVLRSSIVDLRAFVAGSESLSVLLQDSSGKSIAAPIGAVKVSTNRCFVQASGVDRVSLSPGAYKVVMAARGTSPDNLRSFQGINLSVSFI